MTREERLAIPFEKAWSHLSEKNFYTHLITKGEFDQLFYKEDTTYTHFCTSCGKDIGEAEECDYCECKDFQEFSVHEDEECEICQRPFDCFEDAYTGYGEASGLICLDCERELRKFNGFD